MLHISEKESIMGELGEKAKGTANKAVGSVKDAVGDATGNERMQAEGKAQKLKGDTQHASGEMKGALGDKI